MNHKFPDVQDGIRKCRGSRDRTANICWIIKKAREFQKKKIHFCFIDYAKAFYCLNHNELWKIYLKSWEYQTTLPVSCKISVKVKEEQLELDMEQQTGSKLRKEYLKALYRHTA